MDRLDGLTTDVYVKKEEYELFNKITQDSLLRHRQDLDSHHLDIWSLESAIGEEIKIRELLEKKIENNAKHIKSLLVFNGCLSVLLLTCLLFLI